MDSQQERLPANLIRDLEVEPKAQHRSFSRASLPTGLFLMPSKEESDKLGVYTATTIEGGVVFGPFKGKKISTEEITLETNCSSSWDVSM